MSSRDFAVVILIGFAVVVNSRKPNGCSPPTLAHGYLVPEMDSYDQDFELSYACDKLHKPDMGYWSGNSQCTNGMWNPVPKCIIRSHCSSLIISNGEINNGDKTDHEIGDTITFQCNEGFSPRSPVVRCENGDWNPAPKCDARKPNGCSPPTLAHGYLVPEMDSYDQDFELSYACDKLHKPDMGYWSGNSQCTNGMWNPVPKCIIRSHCSSLIISNGEINNGDKTDHEIGDTITFQCNEGFSPRSPVVRCENGDWNPAPKCDGDLCGAVPEIEDAKATVFAFSVLYECNRFHRLVGSVSRIFCYTDGTWSSPLPRCE
ncbi:hypothetical protein NHX12_003639 [Muraenolepis orangiensis]|uniref:Sushi domain-containing protein n=1 Tax=Muraenolepis orangiensis TaxID=630683 RepID=A0A9Q0DXI9_9TELE|nr:hypothetical protein NHX12_003639 [Muraenolepis orangiensis]